MSKLLQHEEDAALTILRNMARERHGLWAALTGRRWVIADEPLRNDAQRLLEIFDARQSVSRPLTYDEWVGSHIDAINRQLDDEAAHD